jgi:hypothetical protein
VSNVSQPPGAEVPAGEPGASAPSPDVAFQQGIELGREWVQQATVKVAAWAEENPGQMVLVGLGLGFVIGKLFFSGSSRDSFDAFDD